MFPPVKLGLSLEKVASIPNSPCGKTPIPPKVGAGELNSNSWLKMDEMARFSSKVLSDGSMKRGYAWKAVGPHEVRYGAGDGI